MDQRRCPNLTRGLRRWASVRRPARPPDGDIRQSDASRRCRPGGRQRRARPRAAAGNRGRRPGAAAFSPTIWCGSRSPSLSIDVLSQVPLQAGQTLQLAVSQSEGGIRLAVVGQGAGAAGSSADTVTLSPGALADAAANPARRSAPPRNVLTPLEKLAVSTAAQTAATAAGQPGAAVCQSRRRRRSNALPPKLQQAVAQVLAQQTSLDQNLTGGDIKNAFQKSGLFLEASLASGSPPPSGVPDLKAALIVLRQTLLHRSVTRPRPRRRRSGAARWHRRGPVLSARHRRAGNPAAAGAPGRRRRSAQASAAASPAAAGRRAKPAAGRAAGDRQPAAGHPQRRKMLRDDDVTFHTNTPPPPFRGALPAAQPIALPSLAPDAPLATTAHHLLADTDAAIARQTLLQVASLPGPHRYRRRRGSIRLRRAGISKFRS